MFCKKRCSQKFCKIHRKTPVAESLFYKSCTSATLLKKRLGHKCFPVNFAKFLKTPFWRNTSGLLLLLIRRRSQSSWKWYVTWTDLEIWPMKPFSEYYKPIRVWLWFVYKITAKNCCSLLFAEFVQTQKWYPAHPWVVVFSCELNFSKPYSLQNICHLSLRL